MAEAVNTRSMPASRPRLAAWSGAWVKTAVGCLAVVGVTGAAVAWLGPRNAPSHWGFADDALYQRLALEISQEGRYGSTFVPPLYPLYLAAASAVVGPDPRMLSLANVPLYVAAIAAVAAFAWWLSRSVWMTALAVVPLAGARLVWMAWTNYSDPLSLVCVYATLGLAAAAVVRCFHGARKDGGAERGTTFSLPLGACGFGLAAMLTRTANLPIVAGALGALVVTPLIAGRRRGTWAYLVLPIVAAGLYVLWLWLSDGAGAKEYTERLVADDASVTSSVAANLQHKIPRIAKMVACSLSPTGTAIVAPILLLAGITAGTWLCLRIAWQAVRGRAEVADSALRQRALRLALPLVCSALFVAMLCVVPQGRSDGTLLRYYATVYPVVLLVFAVGLERLSAGRLPVAAILAIAAADIAISLRLSNRQAGWSLAACLLLYGALFSLRLGRCWSCVAALAAGLGMLYAALGNTLVENHRPGATPLHVLELQAVGRWLEQNTGSPALVFSRKPGFLYLASNRTALQPRPWSAGYQGTRFLEHLLENGSQYVVIDSHPWQPQSRQNWLPAIQRHPQVFQEIHIEGRSSVYQVRRHELAAALNEKAG